MISIPPIGIVIICVFIAIYTLSRGKSKVLQNIYIVSCSIVAFVGIIAIPLICYALNASLSAKGDGFQYFEGLYEELLSKFTVYAITSILVMIIVVGIAIVKLIKCRDDTDKARRIVKSIVAYMIMNIIASIVLGFSTLNKIFDLASYIFLLALAEVYVAHISLIISRRTLSRKNSH